MTCEGVAAETQRQIDMLDKGAELHDPNRPPDWRAGYERNVAALQGQFAEELIVNSALLGERRAPAQQVGWGRAGPGRRAGGRAVARLAEGLRRGLSASAIRPQ